MNKHPNRLGQLRVGKNLTQEELCRRLVVKLSIRNLSRYETGTHEPPVSTAMALAVALDSTVEEVWNVYG